MTKKSTKENRKEFLESLRWYRRKTKERGTYVVKLKPCTEFLDPNDEYAEDETETDRDSERKVARRRHRAKEPKRGVVMLDGRVHPGWNAHVAVSGRLSSSDPINAQNIPHDLRDMFVAEMGHKFIYCDMDQLELRYVAALAGAARYLEVFHRVFKLQGTKIDKLDPNMDPHSATAAMIFPEEWKTSTREGKEKLRNFAKTFSYAVLYGAEIGTIHDVIVSTEDKQGRLIYSHITQRQTREKVDRWLDANPEVERWWNKVFQKYRQLGFLVDSVLGRRRDFLDGEDEVRNEVINFDPQAGGSAIVHLATIDLIEGPLPFFRWGPTTGLINQCHDALLFEVPEARAEWAAKEVQTAMTRFVPGLDVPFTASAKVLNKWSEG